MSDLPTSDTSGVVEPAIGQSVIGSDRGPIGTVKEVRGAYFKVDVPHASDWWVSVESVIEVSDGVLVLAGPAEEGEHLDAGEPPSSEEIAWANESSAVDPNADPTI